LCLHLCKQQTMLLGAKKQIAVERNLGQKHVVSMVFQWKGGQENIPLPWTFSPISRLYVHWMITHFTEFHGDDTTDTAPRLSFARATARSSVASRSIEFEIRLQG
jgi:hypothetical protein